MPYNYVGVDSFTPSLSLPLNNEPTDAEVADAAWEALANRTIYNLDRYYDVVLSQRPSTRDWNYDGTNVVLTKLSRCYAKDAMTGEVTLLAPTLPLSVATGMLLPKVIYYVYLLVTAGVYSLQVTTTQPDAKKVFKTGTQTHKYLGAFSGTMLWATNNGRRLTSNPHRDLFTTGGFGILTSDITIPRTTTTFMASLVYQNTTMSQRDAFVGPFTTGTTRYTIPGMSKVEYIRPLMTSATQTIETVTAAAVGDVTLSLNILGWID